MDEARTEGSTEFAKRMLGTMNEAALALMVSVGHRTGLFDVMVAMPAATSAQTARKMLGEAGFTSIRAAHLDGDIVNTYIIASKD
jgi:hypothetical protein